MDVLSFGKIFCSLALNVERARADKHPKKISLKALLHSVSLSIQRAESDKNFDCSSFVKAFILSGLSRDYGQAEQEEQKMGLFDTGQRM